MQLLHLSRGGVRNAHKCALLHGTLHGVSTRHHDRPHQRQEELRRCDDVHVVQLQARQARPPRVNRRLPHADERERFEPRKPAQCRGHERHELGGRVVPHDLHLELLEVRERSGHAPQELRRVGGHAVAPDADAYHVPRKMWMQKQEQKTRDLQIVFVLAVGWESESDTLEQDTLARREPGSGDERQRLEARCELGSFHVVAGGFEVDIPVDDHVYDIERQHDIAHGGWTRANAVT
jgi:hypothetical protein